MKIPVIMQINKNESGGTSGDFLTGNRAIPAMITEAPKEGQQWYPVCTLPRAEKKALKELTGRGITAYLPLHRQLRQWSDRKKWIEEPLIRSYIFVCVAHHALNEVLMTPGISRFIYFSGKVATIPDRQITELELLLASPFQLTITEENLQPGEKILVKAGPLKGIQGEMIEYRSQKQLLIRLETLGYAIIVQIAAAMIRRR
jgi:transcriptional antiterminator RfaH